MTFPWHGYLGVKWNRSSSKCSLHGLLIMGVPTTLMWLSSSTCLLCADGGPRGAVDFDAIGVVRSFPWGFGVICLWAFTTGTGVNSCSGVERSGDGARGLKFPWWSSVRMRSATFFPSSIIDELAPVGTKTTTSGYHLLTRKLFCQCCVY